MEDTALHPTAIHENPYRGAGLPDLQCFPSQDASPVQALLEQCPAYAPTPLLVRDDLAKAAGTAAFFVKDERARMGLGSFKALGAAYVIARAARAAMENGATDYSTALTGRAFIAASAGNHGLSVAAGARVFGARAIIYLSDTVPEAFANRLRAQGAEPRRAGATYEESMKAAEAAAAAGEGTLLPDSTWAGEMTQGYLVMEGYLQIGAEMAEALDSPPTHIFLQAGVGGMAGALAAHARATWGQTPQIIVVEPDAAPALQDAIAAGHVVDSHGPVSIMGRLDCKTASLVALAGLARDADQFLTISDGQAASGVARLTEAGLASTPSGAAGVIAAAYLGYDFPPDARVLCVLSEGPEDV
ncbi:MAG: pyridoxal-phosphate dependent enzyme [Rhodobacteraceae bacterium]|jgi:diaminopropionate ammonia-lyase|uniref:pyridoxal-phosphate dependent enzyme n=1 Tax=Roseovarius sp. 10 TaxID=3080563 RepID=UPI001935030A|nr:pyridoxal-phosphate dependent enzyme [Roseovarius sp. 10]MBE1289672.1 pyridoxal-phosphate dependent enzyme [Paracoccaceae bacterium]MDV7200841.1 pyridoxal-phosphate dependent enzyme [Roseovarius sp. 10]QPI85294.1 pyridoxal-phosphate dependent enzyme [Rhodobacterales bacterium HKCCA1288]